MTQPKDTSTSTSVAHFADHDVITLDNPLRSVVSNVRPNRKDDPVLRAEKALKDLAGEFDGWMTAECDRLAAAWQRIQQHGLTRKACDELFRAAHDIKGDAATFGYPAAATVATSLCRIIEHSPDIASVPTDILDHHVQAVVAIVRENNRVNARPIAREIGKRLRRVSDRYLKQANRDRPKYLEMIEAPGLLPED